MAQWEAGLGSLAEYCEATRQPAMSDVALLRQQQDAGSEAEVAAAFLTKHDHKTEEIEKLKQEIIDLKQQAQEKKKLADYYDQQIKELEEKFQEKVREYGQIQSELKLTKAFCREQAAVEKEREDVKESVEIPNRRHQEVIVGLERRFLEEKKILEKDTEKKQITMPETAQCEAAL